MESAVLISVSGLQMGVDKADRSKFMTLIDSPLFRLLMLNGEYCVAAYKQLN